MALIGTLNERSSLSPSPPNRYDSNASASDSSDGDDSEDESAKKKKAKKVKVVKEKKERKPRKEVRPGQPLRILRRQTSFESQTVPKPFSILWIRKSRRIPVAPRGQ